MVTEHHTSHPLNEEQTSV